MPDQIKRYLYTHNDEQGHACLEDEGGNTLCVQPEWLPDGALPGATIIVKTSRQPDRVTYDLAIDLSGVHDETIPLEVLNENDIPDDLSAHYAEPILN